jgi:antitoxin PrlF
VPGKEWIVEITAMVTSKGQVTIPKQVRDALGIEEGDQVVFRVEGYRATLARTPDLLELEGSVSVPAARRGASWDEVRRTARNARAARVARTHDSVR